MAAQDILRALSERRLALTDSSLLAQCQDIIHEFGLSIDTLIDALEAAASTGSTIAATDVSRARQQLAKRASRSVAVKRGGQIEQAPPSQHSPDANRYDKSTIAGLPGFSVHSQALKGTPSPTVTGVKRPAAAMAGATPASAAAAGRPPTGSGAAVQRGASMSQVSPGAAAAAAAALYASRLNAGHVVDLYTPADLDAVALHDGTTAAAPAYARIPVASLAAAGFVVQEPLSRFNAVAGGLLRREFTTADALPLVCPSLAAYSSVTGLRSSWPLLPDVLRKALPVTLSAAHALTLLPAASSSSPSASPGQVVGTAVSPGPLSPAAATAPPAALASSPSQSGTSLNAAVAASSPAGPVADSVAALSAAAKAVLALAAAGLPLPSLAAQQAAASTSSAADAAAPSPAAALLLARDPTLPHGFEAVADRGVARPFKYMFTTPQERCDNLEGRLQELTDAISCAYEGVADAVVPVGTASQDAVTYVGRVVTATEGDGKINASSVQIEGSNGAAAASGGAGAGTLSRVHLNLSAMPGFSLFPGQVVGVRGLNPRGDNMLVHALYHGAPPPPPALPAHNVLAVAAAALAARAGPLRVWAAAGPFCLQHELEYTPLSDLLSELAAADRVPDVLVLMGPFVDADHPRVRSGEIVLHDGDGKAIPLPSRDLWSSRVVPALEEYLSLPQLARLHLVLVPACNDVISHPVLPQWPFTDVDLQAFVSEAVRRRVSVVPNPATFCVGDVVVGVTSTDVLFNLNRDEVTRQAAGVPGGGPGLDRVARLAQHVLEQRSYFPMFPAPPAVAGAPTPADPCGYTAADAAVPLELSQLFGLGLPLAPDLLLLPSKLKTFARPLCGTTLVVNPGNLCRGNTGGTYAKMEVFPLRPEAVVAHTDPIVDERAANEGSASAASHADEYASGRVVDRTVVEIVRI